MLEFEVDGTRVLYDGATGFLLEKPEEFDILKVFQKISEFKQHIPARKEWDEAGFWEFTGRYGLAELILETTQDCDLRCRYCIFGGNYTDYRSFTKEYMSEETAKKAIDLYSLLLKKFELLNPFRDPVIAFYGGEPLLNFSLIKFATNYAKEVFEPEFSPRFTITTNGTLLTEEVAYFLIQNNFDILISIDGPEEEHDRNRIFSGGKSSFSLCYKHAKETIQLSKKMGKNPNVYAVAVYDFKTDLAKVREFFNSCEIPLIFLSNVRPSGRDYFSAGDKKMFEEISREMEEHFFTDYLNSKEKRDSFLEAHLGSAIRMSALRPKVYSSPEYPSCMPGYKLFITTKGDILPCERGPSNLVIGDVNQGLNPQKSLDLVENYMKIRSKCNSCELKLLCPICIAMAFPEIPENVCRLYYRGGIKMLSLLVKTLKTDYTYFLPEEEKDDAFKR